MLPTWWHACKSNQRDSHLPLLQTKMGDKGCGGQKREGRGWQPCMQGARASLQCTGCVYFWCLSSRALRNHGVFLKKKKPSSLATTLRKHWCNRHTSCWVEVQWWCVRATEASRKEKNRKENPCVGLHISLHSPPLCSVHLGWRTYLIWLRYVKTEEANYTQPVLKKMSQVTSFYCILSVSTPPSAVCQSNKIIFTAVTVQRGCITLSEHVSHSQMQITLKPAKTGATVFEYDVLFSAGLLLSAVVAFYLPFTYFTCQKGWCSAAAPSVGERWELQGGSVTWPMELL